MNVEFAEQINPELEKFNFSKAVDIAETELAKIPVTPFHGIIKNSLLHHTKELAEWIEDFYQLASGKYDIQSLYFEMVEFDINTDIWYIDGFAYDTDEGLDPDDMEWLSDFQTDSRIETRSVFKIDGYEKLQAVFETIDLNTPDLKNARDWCEQLIIARYTELMRAAHLYAKENQMSWSEIPIYFTEHAYDFVLRSEN